MSGLWHRWPSQPAARQHCTLELAGKSCETSQTTGNHLYLYSTNFDGFCGTDKTQITIVGQKFKYTRPKVRDLNKESLLKIIYLQIISICIK